MGDREPEVLSSLAGRLARLDRHLTPKDREAIEVASHGVTAPRPWYPGLVESRRPRRRSGCRPTRRQGQDDPPESAVAEARRQMLEDAARPFACKPRPPAAV